MCRMRMVHPHSISSLAVFQSFLSPEELSVLLESSGSSTPTIYLCCNEFRPDHPKVIKGKEAQLFWLKSFDERSMNPLSSLLYSCFVDDGPYRTRHSMEPSIIVQRSLSTASTVQQPPTAPPPSDPLSEKPKEKRLRPAERDSRPREPLKRTPSSQSEVSFPQIEQLGNPLLSASASKTYLSSLVKDEHLEFTPRELLILKTLEYHLETRIEVERSYSATVHALEARADEARSAFVQLEKEHHGVSTQKDQLHSLLSLSKSANGYTFASILARQELKFWTGFSSGSEFQTFIVDFFKAASNVGKRGVSLKTPKLKINIEDRLVWVFMLLYKDLSFNELWQLAHQSNDFRGEKSGFRKLIKRTASKLGAHCRRLIAFPDSTQQWKAHNVGTGSSDYNDIYCLVVDGTSLPVFNPKLHLSKRLMFVKYKKHCAYRWFILTGLDGFIFYHSSLQPGIVTDATEFTLSGVSSALTELSTRIKATDPKATFAILGDKGYIDLKPPNSWRLIITKSGIVEEADRSDQTVPEKAPRRRKESPEASLLAAMIEENRASVQSTSIAEFESESAKPRAVVERSFGIVKRYKKLAAGTIRVHDDPVLLWNLCSIACYVTNLNIEKKISFRRPDKTSSVPACSSHAQ